MEEDHDEEGNQTPDDENQEQEDIPSPARNWGYMENMTK